MTTTINQPTLEPVPKIKWAAIWGAGATALLAGLNTFAGELMTVLPVAWQPLVVLLVALAAGYIKKDEVG
jgi:hypothetical protein